MSAGRKHRRAAARHRATEALRAADQAPAVYVREIGAGAVWMKGKVMFVLPRAQPGMPPALVAAIEIRNRASLTGLCPACGARRHVRERPGHVGAAAFRHEEWCVAGGEVDELARRHGWEPA